MASVDWLKATTQYAGAMKKHNGKDERVNGNHSNKDIDKSKSHLNVYIGADDYTPMLEKVKARIKEVDEKYPPKRNMGDKRITCIMLETPVPQEITEQGKAADFLRSAHKVIEDFFGAENVGGTCGHLDEQHWYTDKDGKERLSLVHGHTIVAAYAEWTDQKTGKQRIGINGKNCETKARLKALNNAMDYMCRREYGISYNTAETPQRKSVERLKVETELRKEIAELEAKKQVAERQLSELNGKILTAEELKAIEGKKSLGGALKNVTWEQWQSVKLTADQAESDKSRLKKEITRLRQKLKQVESENKQLTDENTAMRYELTSPLSNTNLTRIKEHTDLKNQIRLLRKTLNLCTETIGDYGKLRNELIERGYIQPNSQKRKR